MKHLSLDTQADAVKQFVLSLSADPDGSVLELDGRAVLQVLPVTVRPNGAAGDWTEAKNARRCELIDREIEGLLTADEASELTRLQQEMLRHRRRVAPLPLDDARRLHQQLLEQARAAPRPSDP
jgi:hypothetical protein